MDFARIRGVVSAGVIALGLAITSATPVKAARQEAQPEKAKLDQVLGTVTGINAVAKTFTVKDDKTGAEYTVNGEATRRFLKVPPGEKDLKKAQPIELSQIAVGDRLMARGRKDDTGTKLDALIVIVMTAGDLQQRHEAELSDWQKRGSRGLVANIDPATKQVSMTERTPEGPKTVTVVTTDATRFTRYAPTSIKFADAKPGTFADLKPGDELRILGDKSDDGQKVTAEQVISGSFATVPATIVSVSADGKQLQATNLKTKQPITVTITDDSAVRQLPSTMALMLARRMNGGGQGAPPANGAAPAGGPTRQGMPAAGQPAAGPGPFPGAGPGGAARGDISQMLERLPKGSVSDLKPGQPVVISGGVNGDPSHLIAINIISGVEPLFAAPAQGGGRRGGGGADLSNWNLDIGTPGEQ